MSKRGEKLQAQVLAVLRRRGGPLSAYDILGTFREAKGYRGHDYDGKAKVMISGKKRGLTPTMKRELKRRSAIEPMIGHAKNDGRLGRNYLLGTDGDKINALLAAAGHNLRLVLTRLARLLTRLIGAVAGLITKIGLSSIDAEPEPVFSNIGLRFSGNTTSMA